MYVHPVIHVRNVHQVLDQVSAALRHPVDGVFLIDHDADDARLVRCIAAVRAQYPAMFLGANFIRRSAVEALHILAPVFPEGIPLDAIWADSAGVDLDGRSDAFDRLAVARRATGWRGLHFGGVAFKYQAPVAEVDLVRLGELARRGVDIPTTSGPGTGQAASVGKLTALRAGLGDHPLALASGVTPENVTAVTGLVDHVLVSTGINDDSDRIDDAKLAELLRRCVGTRREQPPIG